MIGLFLEDHGLRDEVRLRSVHIAWRQVIEAKLADRTAPDTLARGTLTVYANTSAWMQELRFYRARMIEQINRWIEARRAWLGPWPLVSDLRFVLGRPREPLVDPEQVRQLEARDRGRLPPPDVVPPVVTEAERETIRAETSVVEDDELRATIEQVRVRWNR